MADHACKQSSLSHEVETYMTALARKYEYTRFIRLAYDEAEMDAAGVPAVLAYKNGELFANLVSVVDEIPAERELSASSLEAVLQRYGEPCERWNDVANHSSGTALFEAS